MNHQDSWFPPKLGLFIHLGYVAKNHGLIRSLLSPKDRARWDPFQNGLYKWFVNRCYYLLTNWDDPPRRVHQEWFIGHYLFLHKLIEKKNISMGNLKRLCTPQSGAGFCPLVCMNLEQEDLCCHNYRFLTTVCLCSPSSGMYAIYLCTYVVISNPFYVHPKNETWERLKKR